MITDTANNGGKLANGALKSAVLRYRLFLILLLQLFLVVVSYFMSFYIRFEFAPTEQYLIIMFKTLPLLIISRMAAYYYFKLHSGSWRFVSMQDLMDTVKAVGVGSVLFVIEMVFIYHLEHYPRSVLIMEPLLNVLLVGGSRFFIRYYYEFMHKGNQKTLKLALIAGAGKAGVMVLNEIRTNLRLGIKVVGFVDDDPFKKRTTIQGVPVMGNIESIPELVKKYGVDEVIIAIPSAGYKDITRIANIAKNTGVETKTLPGLGKLIGDETFIGQFKDVSCNELLGRRTIQFCRESDRRLIEEEIKGKAVLVTGAAGSIGSELCRQVCRFNPRMLILYERHENGLYELELELKKEFPDQKILPVVGDILNAVKVGSLLDRYRVDLIYHAAAYKHVPMMEREPIEAVRNNVLGTLTLTHLAIAHEVKKFVLISTDKAVNPANIMGTTKRVAELVIQGLSGNGVKFIAVRFGNVIGSNGSVIPLFKRQIAEGGPVTVTHEEVTRYFMAIPEAVQLVMTAGAMGKGGEIFLLDMGKPIKITDLANELIRRYGMKPGKDIEVVITGLRPGEKLYEELYWEGEGIVPTENKKITMLKPNGVNRESLFGKVELLKENMEKNDLSGVLRALKEIAPEAKLQPPDMGAETQ